MRRWLTIGLAAAIAALGAVLALVLSGGHDGRSAVPDGRATTVETQPRLRDARVPARPARRPKRAATPAPAAPAARLPTGRARSADRLILIGFGGTEPSQEVLQSVADHEWGGVVLEPGNGSSPQQVAGLVGQLRGWALSVRHEAPLIAAAQLGGANDAVPVGSAAQSAAPDAAAAQRSALNQAKVLRPLGIRLVLAPIADTSTPGGPWEGLAFSDDPGDVTAMAGAAVAGWKRGHVAPAPGHFPGEGAASGDPVEGAASVGLSLDELRQRDLRPFVELAKHAPAIQLSSAIYVAYDGVTPATLLPAVVDQLRSELGFRGVVISGDLAAASLATGRSVASLAVAAVRAGCDLLWIPGDAAAQDAATRAIVRALRSGALPVARVAQALGRVAQLRAHYGVS